MMETFCTIQNFMQGNELYSSLFTGEAIENRREHEEEDL
jgi:hypothetical protein